jgi:hypothetical protein
LGTPGQLVGLQRAFLALAETLDGAILMTSDSRLALRLQRSRSLSSFGRRAAHDRNGEDPPLDGAGTGNRSTRRAVMPAPATVATRVVR